MFSLRKSTLFFLSFICFPIIKFLVQKKEKKKGERKEKKKEEEKKARSRNKESKFIFAI